jgi:hypothetical protein
MDKAAISAKNRFFSVKPRILYTKKPPTAVVGHSTCDSLTTGTNATIAKTASSIRGHSAVLVNTVPSASVVVMRSSERLWLAARRC